MWILKVTSGAPAKSEWYSISRIGHEKTYTLGKKTAEPEKDPNVDITVDSLYISKCQLQLKLKHGMLYCKNCGDRSLQVKQVTDENYETFSGKSKQWSIKISSDSILYRNFKDGEFCVNFYKLGIKHVILSKFIARKIDRLVRKRYEYYIDSSLSDYQVKIDGVLGHVTSLEDWVKKVNSQAGDLVQYYAPSFKPLNNSIEVPPSDGEEYQTIPPPTKKDLQIHDSTGNFIEIADETNKLAFSQVKSQKFNANPSETQSSLKTQLPDIVDIFDNDDDEYIRSQKRPKKLQTSGNKINLKVDEAVQSNESVNLPGSLKMEHRIDSNTFSNNQSNSIESPDVEPIIIETTQEFKESTQSKAKTKKSVYQSFIRVPLERE
ncbi:hypothetical protein DAMA08_012310 [Martiniozyma asiatica (nom. inval.)]|nr:hypothetical protein DAMA08_012310 [Martiniozyma asiatica]